MSASKREQRDGDEKGVPNREERDADGKLLRLKCPFCDAEYPLWFRAENFETTLTPTEWEQWLDSQCVECGKTPRQALKT